MYKQILLKAILPLLLISIISNKTKAQHNFGVEAGVTIASLYSSNSDFRQIPFSPSIGARTGLFWESAITDFFAIKTGLSGELKGHQIDNNGRWDLIYLTLPVLAIFTPVKPLKLGIGIEAGAVVFNNIPLLEAEILTLGIRSEIAWQINPSFRLMAHTTVDITRRFYVHYTDDQGNPIDKVGYNNISGGLSLAYTIKTFDKKG